MGSFGEEFQNAVCAVHPEQPAGAICERCGAFYCGLCQGTENAAICQACEQIFNQRSLGDLFSDGLKFGVKLMSFFMFFMLMSVIFEPEDYETPLWLTILLLMFVALLMVLTGATVHTFTEWSKQRSPESHEPPTS